MAKIDSLKNKSGEVIYPRTLTNAVYDKEGVSLKRLLAADASKAEMLIDIINASKYPNYLVKSEILREEVIVDGPVTLGAEGEYVIDRPLDTPEFMAGDLLLIEFNVYGSPKLATFFVSESWMGIEVFISSLNQEPYEAIRIINNTLFFTITTEKPYFSTSSLKISRITLKPLGTCSAEDAGLEYPDNAHRDGNFLYEPPLNLAPIRESLAHKLGTEYGTLKQYVEEYYMMYSATVIDLQNNNNFVKNITANTSFTIINPKTDGWASVQSFTLFIQMNSPIRTITFPASIKWQGGAVPVLNAVNTTYILTFVTIDKGVTWFGMFGGEF